MAARHWPILALSIILVALAGCGDPSKDRLAVGQRAMAVRHGEEKHLILLHGSGDAIWPILAPGTHLTVVDDGLEPPEPNWPTRPILVHVEDGQHAGKSGQLDRWNVHPVR